MAGGENRNIWSEIREKIKLNEVVPVEQLSKKQKKKLRKIKKKWGQRETGEQDKQQAGDGNLLAHTTGTPEDEWDADQEWWPDEEYPGWWRNSMGDWWGEEEEYGEQHPEEHQEHSTEHYEEHPEEHSEEHPKKHKEHSNKKRKHSDNSTTTQHDEHSTPTTKKTKPASKRTPTYVRKSEVTRLGGSPGCKGCDNVARTTYHNTACQQRFLEIWQKEGWDMSPQNQIKTYHNKD